MPHGKYIPSLLKFKASNGAQSESKPEMGRQKPISCSELYSALPKTMVRVIRWATCTANPANKQAPGVTLPRPSKPAWTSDVPLVRLAAGRTGDSEECPLQSACLWGSHYPYQCWHILIECLPEPIYMFVYLIRYCVGTMGISGHIDNHYSHTYPDIKKCGPYFSS